MEQSELKEILEQHKLWIDTSGQGGKRANLRGADLRGANLEGANLRDADLRGANLCGANLYRADLEDADLTGANLYRANLTGANLEDADLTGANLYRANLTGAYLAGAKLAGAILPDISWIIPGCLAQLNQISYSFYLGKERKYDNFIQDSIGFFIQDNMEEKTFDILAGDRIIRNIPEWVKYFGLKQVVTESV